LRKLCSCQEYRICWQHPRTLIYSHKKDNDFIFFKFLQIARFARTLHRWSVFGERSTVLEFFAYNLHFCTIIRNRRIIMPKLC
jgi:hypothetical protein